jgi:DNA ligase (NAD+)
MGWIRTVADIYRLGEHRADISLMEGFGDKSAAKIAASVEDARSREATRFLVALSIPLCGIDVCRRLLGAYPLRQLIDLATDPTTDLGHLAHIPGIGPEKSAAFIQWFRNADNHQAVERLLNKVYIEEPSLQPTGSLCQNLTFVITGDVHHYKNRKELQQYIESQGGKVVGSVSGSTNFLINNDLNSTSSKNLKARELNIPILSEEDFIQQFTTAAPAAHTAQDGSASHAGGDTPAKASTPPSPPFMNDLFG